MDRIAVRRRMIAIAQRRRPRGSGSDLNFLMKLQRKPLPVDIAALFEGTAYVVVDGVATRWYMPERFTRDIDVLVTSAVYQTAADRLRAAGWSESGKLTFPNTTLRLRGSIWRFGEIELDLITGEGEWVDEATGHSARGDAGVRVVDLPYLVLMKLDAGRTQDTSDISRMLGGAEQAALERTREIVRRYAPDSAALEDLESLIEIGRWERANEHSERRD